jgi:hypothetical protein
MKRMRMTMSIMVVSVFFLSASIWEGTAAVAPKEELPREGFFAATNTFPLNTEVYISNLTNGKTIRAVVTAGLDSPAFLAMLSRDAAVAMEIEDQAVARVRLIPPSEITQFSRLAGRMDGSEYPGGVFSPPLVFVPEPVPVQPEIPDKELPDIMAAPPRPEERIPPGLYFPQGPAEPTETISGALPPASAASGSYEGYDLALIPAEERPPDAGSWGLPGDAEIAPLASPPVQPDREIDPSLIIPSMESAGSARSPDQNTGRGYSGFSVPVIHNLEGGKYYLQLRAFGRVELVEAELSRIGKNYPLVIQSADSVYRILVGPVSLGESGALLQRFKGIGYNDAFIRQGI